ncbi:hypothetical protein [Parachlamydia acanthamoebae]|uniref:Uncharacterized protein n=1 Tax=Parachlamydia acanthamoebae TaxID=83552 RepID=A0A0C1E8L8_9BACT|nr:hypothetical protein [Parachlamydia acanthamoebae]KIA76458.1 hypothetical protein DB43_AG00360 [Parachlamydia acanthamoebae]
MGPDTICVYQKNWAYATPDSPKPILTTGSFGPCYVVTLISEKCTAMAHVDDTTQVESIKQIFAEFSKRSIQFKDVQVVILGGWKEHGESKEWGDKIFRYLCSAGFSSINLKYMFSKKMPEKPGDQQIFADHFYGAARVDARSGKMQISATPDGNIAREQARQMLQNLRDHGSAYTTIEHPLTQVEF